MLGVLAEDYVRTAFAKGLAPRAVLVRHALKNASLPVITLLGIEFAFLIGGLVVTETVFNLPGVARYLIEAIQGRDYPVVQNLVMFIAIIVVMANLTVDLLYAWVDPRIKYGKA
jgi:peptide/nickel transport system permease protein